MAHVKLVPLWCPPQARSLEDELLKVRAQAAKLESENLKLELMKSDFLRVELRNYFFCSLD